MQTKLLLFIIVMCSCASNKYERKAWETLENSDANKVELTNFLSNPPIKYPYKKESL